MIRLFAALSVPAEAGASLTALQAGVPGARWRPHDALHITLRFFGEVSETVAADLDDLLAGVRMEAFDVEVAGVGAFGANHQMRAIWAGVAAAEPLTRLAARCETAARRCGVKAETRAYRPHVTLAYLKHAAEPHVAAWVQAHGRLRCPPWRAWRFDLYSSWRSAQGSRYELERAYPLQRSGPATSKD